MTQIFPPEAIRPKGRKQIFTSASILEIVRGFNEVHEFVSQGATRREHSAAYIQYEPEETE